MILTFYSLLQTADREAPSTRNEVRGEGQEPCTWEGRLTDTMVDRNPLSGMKCLALHLLGGPHLQDELLLSFKERCQKELQQATH